MPKEKKVTIVKSANNLTSDLQKTLEPLGGINNFVKPGEKVLLKPNLNTADPYPASSDINFLEAVVNVVKTAKPGKIILGDSCTLTQRTQRVMEDLTIFEFGKKMDIEVVNFDKEKFVKKKLPDTYLKIIRIPKILDEVDKIIILPCLKTHRYAKFTMSLKLAVGLMKKRERAALHALGHLEEKIAEINLIYKPNLIILDGRKAFVTLGPEKGELVEPNILMAGTDRIAIDVEALKILKSYPAENYLGGDIWQLTQIKRAVELGLGVKSEEEYKVINL